MRLINPLKEVAKNNNEINDMLPKDEQLVQINELLTKCQNADEVTKFLQREDVTIADVREVLDIYIKTYPDSVEYIGPNSKV